jgi:hypothetical protein
MSSGSYGSSNRGNDQLGDLNSFVVAPLRPGAPIVKNFYAESSLIVSRPQVKAPHCLPWIKIAFFQHLNDQFYTQNEMSVRGYAPKPILSFDEIQFPRK